MPDLTAAENLYNALKSFVASGTTARSGYDVAKDFQPLLAAAVALAAAIGGTLFAYRGAQKSFDAKMIEITSAREDAERERQTLRRNAYVRLRSQMARLEQDATRIEQEVGYSLLSVKREIDEQLSGPARYGDDMRLVTWQEEFGFDDFDELEIAWEKNDLFSDRSIRQIDLLRSRLVTARKIMDRWIADRREDNKINFILARVYRSNCEDIKSGSHALIELLKDAREKLPRAD